MKAFTARLNRKFVDRVFYDDSDPITTDEVKRSLVDHDGYNPNITVTRDRTILHPKRGTP